LAGVFTLGGGNRRRLAAPINKLVEGKVLLEEKSEAVHGIR